MYRVLLDRQARRQLDDLLKANHKDWERVTAAVAELKEQPRPHGVVMLKKPIHRIRVGRYRVIYSILDEEKVVLVHEVATRRETTYKPYR